MMTAVKLFEPGHIGKVQLKNRIVMAPMGMGRMDEDDGNWGPRVQEYFLARSRGGTGLVTTCGIMVTQKLEPFTSRHFNVYSDKHLDALRRIADDAHCHGAKISVQLSAGLGRVLPKFLMDLNPDPNIPPVSASPGPYFYNPSVICRALAIEEVEELAHSFGEAAKRCQMAGADIVELNGHNGYILDQFMSAIWNQRNDKYGGSRENRLTLAREIIESIKQGTAGSMPVVYRFGMDHYVEGGRTLEESSAIARELEAMGYDALHVDAGCYETPWRCHPTMYQARGSVVNMAAKAKSTVKIPVIAVGKLHYPDLAEGVLQDGKADFIALGRGLLADPEWPLKVRENRRSELVLCIVDCEGCIGELYKGHAVSCTVNPICGHEKEWRLTPIKKERSLLVIGGGPAGMEAARLGVMRGLSVTLWEKSDKLGGNLRVAGAPASKRDLLDLLDYQSTQLRSLRVAVKLNTEGVAKDICASGADFVVLATGAIPKKFDLPGAAANRTMTAIDLLLGRGNVGKRVVVVGGGLVGCETALHLANERHEVVLTTRGDSLMNDVNFLTRTTLLALLKECGVKVMTSIRPQSVVREGLLAKQNDKQVTIPSDAIVLSAGMWPCNELQAELTGRVANLFAIGDCVQPRLIMNAIWEAFHTVRSFE